MWPVFNKDCQFSQFTVHHCPVPTPDFSMAEFPLGSTLHFNRDFQFRQFTPLPTLDFSMAQFMLHFKIYSPMEQFMSRYVAFKQWNSFSTVSWLHSPRVNFQSSAHFLSLSAQHAMVISTESPETGCISDLLMLNLNMNFQSSTFHFSLCLWNINLTAWYIYAHVPHLIQRLNLNSVWWSGNQN